MIDGNYYPNSTRTWFLAHSLMKINSRLVKIIFGLVKINSRLLRINCLLVTISSPLRKITFPRKDFVENASIKCSYAFAFAAELQDSFALLNQAGVKYATLNKRGTSVKLEETKFRI